MKRTWRYVDYSSKDPYMNLAIEEALARGVLELGSPNTLRLWQHPKIVSIGCFQRPEQEVNIDYCRRNGIKIVRRMSAGGAVYQDSGNLNYSLYIDTSELKSFRDPVESYSYLCRGLIIALRSLGLDAEFRPVNDVVVGGRKISGNAQHQLYSVLVHHGTLLMDLNFDNLEKALTVPREKLRDKGVTSVRERVTTIKKELGRKIPTNTVKSAVLRGYAEALGVRFKKSRITREEIEIAKKLYEKYSSPEWIFGKTCEFEHQTAYKAAGGLVRVSLTLSKNRIKRINIGGDFFVNPPEALRTTPGVTPADLITAIMQPKIVP
ncbi:MAG: lipoyl protein ligase domain-containing protein [Candidatus Freyarchaeota archaeon]